MFFCRSFSNEARTRINPNPTSSHRLTSNHDSASLQYPNLNLSPHHPSSLAVKTPQPNHALRRLHTHRPRRSKTKRLRAHRYKKEKEVLINIKTPNHIHIHLRTHHIYLHIYIHIPTKSTHRRKHLYLYLQTQPRRKLKLTSRSQPRSQNPRTNIQRWQNPFRARIRRNAPETCLSPLPFPLPSFPSPLPRLSTFLLSLSLSNSKPPKNQS